MWKIIYISRTELVIGKGQSHSLLADLETGPKQEVKKLRLP